MAYSGFPRNSDCLTALLSEAHRASQSLEVISLGPQALSCRDLTHPPCVWLLGRPGSDETLPSFPGHSSQFQQSLVREAFRYSSLLLLFSAL